MAANRFRQFRSYLARRLSFASSMLYDARRFARYSFALSAARTQDQRRAELTMEYHRIEKGLALPDPRPGFGVEVVRKTMRLLKEYEARYGLDDLAASVFHVLVEYESFNREAGNSLPEMRVILEEWAQRFQVSGMLRGGGGTLCVTRDEILGSLHDGFEAFAQARHSVRHFGSDPVSPDQIERAVRIAQRAPSVCNRQSGRVHVFSDRHVIDQLLALQGGNRGFGGQIQRLLLVASDLQCFSNAGERTQAWTDGGMFAMSLVFGLHAVGLGTCCLNWSKTPDRDLELRELVPIPASQTVLMMVGVGTLPERFSVALSYRRPVEEILRFH